MEIFPQLRRFTQKCISSLWLRNSHENFITFDVSTDESWSRTAHVIISISFSRPMRKTIFHFPSRWPFLTSCSGWTLEILLFCIKMTWSRFSSPLFVPASPLQLFFCVFQRTIHHSRRLFVFAGTSGWNWLPSLFTVPIFHSELFLMFSLQFSENFSSAELDCEIWWILFSTENWGLNSKLRNSLRNPLQMSFPVIATMISTLRRRITQL